MSYLSDECYEAHNPGAIFVFVTQTPCLVACIGITVLFWYNYHYQQSDAQKSSSNVIKTSIQEKSTQDSRYIQKIGGITLIIYSLFILVVYISFIMDISMDCPDSSVWILIIAVGFYMGGFLGVITLFTNRIIIAFKNTKYQASPRLLTTVKIIGISVVILMASMSILRLVNVIGQTVQDGISLFAVLLPFFYCLILLRLFLSKLNGVINDFAIKFGNLPKKQLIKLTRSNSGSFDASKMTKDNDFNFDFNFEMNWNENENDNVKAGAQDGTNKPYVTRLINDISELKIKYTIMVIVAIISSLFFLILAMISVEIFKVNGPIRLKGKVQTAILSIDSFVNCFVLFLQFDFSQNLYKKFCIFCHNKCQDRYTNKTNKQLIKSGHGNMKLERTKSKEIIFKSNSNNNNNTNENKNNNENTKDKIDVVYDNECNNDNVAVGQKIINTLQA